MIPFAQAELIKPPQPGESVNLWLVYALVMLLMAMVSCLIALHYYNVKVFIPKLLSDFWGAMDTKDKTHSAERIADHDSCEKRADRRSEAHREEIKQLLALVGGRLSEEDFRKPLGRRRRQQDPDRPEDKQG